MSQQKTEWRPHQGSQERALASNAYELLFGGSAGGGKSDFLLVDALGQITNPAYKAILFRKTYPDLEKSLILRSHELYPALGGKYHAQNHRWTFPSGAMIDFGYLANEKDVYNYQGSAYAYIGFDEATHFTQFQIEYLKSRNRCADSTVRKYIRYATNPGNVGHFFFKNRFIDNKEPFKIYNDSKTGLTMQFIPSRVYDNFTLMREDPDYVKRLEGLPDNEKKKLLYGSWDVFEGQFFSEFNQDIHVIEPFTIPHGWKRYAGIDYGSTNPFAGVFVAVDYDGNIYIYKEYYATGLTAYQNAKGIHDLCVKDSEWQEHISAWFIDPAVFSNHGAARNGDTIGDILRRSDSSTGYLGLPVMAASNRRTDGWNTVREYLRESKGKKIRIFRNCVNLIRTIPLMVYDTHDQEDLDTTLEDHALDALRYVLQTLRDRKSPDLEMSRDKTLEERFKEKLQAKKEFDLNNFYNV